MKNFHLAMRALNGEPGLLKERIDIKKAVAEFERELIALAYWQAGGVTRQAARMVRYSYGTFRRRHLSFLKGLKGLGL